LFLWSAQAIYARAFYAAGNTRVPMIAGTIITLISVPIYASLYHAFGVAGLAAASDIGIALQTCTIAVLLHQRHMVSLASLDYREMGRCLLAGVFGGLIVWLGLWAFRGMMAHLPGAPARAHMRIIDLGIVLVGGAVWLAAAKWVLEKTGSALPRAALRRVGLA
ncbi:MAG: lipid II flippase MurJ, partial [Terracidiphilus sp.]